MSRERHVKLFRNGRNQAVRIPASSNSEAKKRSCEGKATASLSNPPLPSLCWPCSQPWLHCGRISHPFRICLLSGGPLMRYLLDTNIVSDLVRNPQGKVADRIRKVGEAQVCTSIIVAAEIRYGAEKRRRLSSRPSLNWCWTRSKFCLWRPRPISPTVSFERALSEQVNLSATMIYLLPLRDSPLGIPLLPITTRNSAESRTFAARTGCAEARSFCTDISL